MLKNGNPIKCSSGDILYKMDNPKKYGYLSSMILNHTGHIQPEEYKNGSVRIGEYTIISI